MNNNEDNKFADIPVGLGMAFAQNQKAMLRFAGMNAQQRQRVISHAHTVRSKQEMEAFVSGLSVNTNAFDAESD